jgi:hypothetical protein
MNASWKDRAPLLIGAAVLVAALAVLARWQPAQAQRELPATGGSPHYTVVETEGHNLIVTDNRKDTLYFYTIDKDAKIGSELKLRGQVDLEQVGKKVIKPENVHLRKE